MRKSLLIAALCLAAAGCAAPGAKAAAENAVTRFHQLLDAGRFHDIYQATAPEFRNVTSEEQLNGLLQTVHDRLGAVRQARQQNWHYDYTNGVTRVDLSYETSFASGTGVETFAWRINNGVPTLLSYDLRSDALRGGDNGGGKPVGGGEI